MEPVNQPDYLDGAVVHIGAENEPAAVHLAENGTLYECTANTTVATKLSSHVNGAIVRAYGSASWIRGDGGDWKLQQFSIEDFITLEDKTLAQAIAELDEKNRSR
jgi:hypothetical protein